MPDYRVFTINSSNKIASVVEFEARDDFHAAEIANQVADATLVEVWHGTLLVGQYERERQAGALEAALLCLAMQRRYRRRALQIPA